MKKPINKSWKNMIVHLEYDKKWLKTILASISAKLKERIGSNLKSDFEVTNLTFDIKLIL